MRLPKPTAKIISQQHEDSADDDDSDVKIAYKRIHACKKNKKKPTTRMLREQQERESAPERARVSPSVCMCV